MIPQSKELVYYTDLKCTKPFPYDSKTQRQRIISEVATRIGESGSMTVYLRNESKNEFEALNIILSDSTLQVQIDKPTIKSGMKTKLLLSWTVQENHPDRPYEANFIIEGEFIIRS